MRNELAVDLEERDYARQPLSETELKELFKAVDPRDYLNPKSPAFKSMNLKGRSLTADQAIKLMAEEPNLLKRPLTIRGRTIIAGFDRERLREVLS